MQCTLLPFIPSAEMGSAITAVRPIFTLHVVFLEIYCLQLFTVFYCVALLLTVLFVQRIHQVLGRRKTLWAKVKTETSFTWAPSDPSPCCFFLFKPSNFGPLTLKWTNCAHKKNPSAFLQAFVQRPWYKIYTKEAKHQKDVAEKLRSLQITFLITDAVLCSSWR